MLRADDNKPYTARIAACVCCRFALCSSLSGPVLLGGEHSASWLGLSTIPVNFTRLARGVGLGFRLSSASGQCGFKPTMLLRRKVGCSQEDLRGSGRDCKAQAD